MLNRLYKSGIDVASDSSSRPATDSD